jgi:thymidylate synthase
VKSTQTRRNAISLLWNQPKQGEMPLVCCGINPNKEKCHYFVVESTQTRRNAIILLWNQPKQGEMPLVCCGINPNKEKCH